MAQIIIDQPLEREQIHMVVRRLQPMIVRHLIGMTFTDFASLTSALLGVEEVLLEVCGKITPVGILRGRNH